MSWPPHENPRLPEQGTTSFVEGTCGPGPFLSVLVLFLTHTLLFIFFQTSSLPSPTTPLIVACVAASDPSGDISIHKAPSPDEPALPNIIDACPCCLSRTTVYHTRLIGGAPPPRSPSGNPPPPSHCGRLANNLWPGKSSKPHWLTNPLTLIVASSSTASATRPSPPAVPPTTPAVPFFLDSEHGSSRAPLVLVAHAHPIVIMPVDKYSVR